jgi:acetyl-CoA carboxylase biotin carboxyl carrier protein
MTFKEIQDLIKLMDKSSLTEFSYEHEGIKIKIKGQQLHSGQPTYALPSLQQQPMLTGSYNIPSAVESVPTNAVSTSTSEMKASEAVETTQNLIEIKSPMVGTFYRSSSPGKPTFVNVGDIVNKGSVLCVIEAMKLFNEIESEFSGKIVKVMVEDASPVEYDQVLFLVEA